LFLGGWCAENIIGLAAASPWTWAIVAICGFVGMASCSIYGAKLVGWLSSKLADWIDPLSSDEEMKHRIQVVANAFDMLEIDPEKCDNVEDVNRAYKRKALIMHPDRKHGNKEHFQQLQVSKVIALEFVKEKNSSRGERIWKAILNLWKEKKKSRFDAGMNCAVCVCK